MQRALLLLLIAAVCTPLLRGQNNTAATTQPVTGSASSSTSSTAAARRENRDPLLDLPELPPGTVTLIGGTVVDLDEVMNKMIVQPFGSKDKMKIAFDTRTSFFQDGKAISHKSIRQGQQVYLDTTLNGTTVFAKKIWIQTSAEGGIGRGQITDFDEGRRILTVRDELSSEPIKLQLGPNAVIRKQQKAASLADLVPGALVSVSFGPRRDVREVTLLASPGSTFVFAGRITYLDLSRNIIAIDNRADRTNYDVSIEAIPRSIVQQLHQGSDVNVAAVFDGTRYAARDITVASLAP